MSEKRIEADVIDALKSLGFAVTKTSQPRPSMITLGVPDLYASHARHGIRAWIEVKTPGGRVTDHQAAWHEAERAAGGTVIVAHSASDVVDQLAEMGLPVR